MRLEIGLLGERKSRKVNPAGASVRRLGDGRVETTPTPLKPVMLAHESG